MAYAAGEKLTAGMSLVLETRQLSKRFVLRHNAKDVKSRALGMLRIGEQARREEFWALRGVSIRVAGGESVGLVGRNGSGKSTLLKVIAGIHRPTGGHMLVRRGVRISSMIELGTGFHPELTGQENVLLNASIHGLSREEALAIYDRVVSYSGLRHFMDVPIKNYSSGMHMRLGFAIAANLDPDVLLLDEIFAVGDEEFQRQCMGTLESFLEAGKTILFVSHSAAAVQAICRRVCVLDRGQLRFDGDVDSGLTEYRRLNAASPHQPLGVELDPGTEAKGHDAASHRLATGGRWDEEGEWAFEFLRSRGLRPDQYLLDVGCGSLAAAARLLPFMDQSHYWGFEKNVELFVAGVQIELPRANVRPERGHFVVNDDFDLSSAPHQFDVAIASSLLRRLPLNAVGRCFASVIRKLTPGGTFYIAFAEPGPDPFAPRVQPDGTTTQGDRPPYHYDIGVLSRLAELAGGRTDRVADARHPRGDTVVAITRA